MNKYFCIDCKRPLGQNGQSIRCRSCGAKKRWEDPNQLIMISQKSKEYWDKHPGRRITTSKQSRKLWKEDSAYRIAVTQKAKQRYQNPIWHKITGEALKKKWQDQEFRTKHSGYKNPFYINGKYIDLYGPGFTLSLKKEIRIRDNFKCQNCGYQENGRALHIHHIDYSKENHKLNNLISLCKPCHDKTLARKERLKWKLYYQNIMKNKNYPAVMEILAT